MALECSYCGARAPDGATRCPQCLRATGLEPAAESPSRAPLSRKHKTAALAVATLLIGGAAAAVSLSKRVRADGERAVRDGTASVSSDVPAPFARLDALTALAGRARDPLAQARTALDALREKLSTHGHTSAPLVEQGLAPSRSIEQLSAAIESRSARFTSLDLARLLYSALDGAGVTVRFARRATGSRPDTAADPSGALGRFVVLVGDHAIDPLDAQPIAARDARATVLTAANATGAMLVQSALASMLSGDRAKAATLLTRAVDQWPDAGLAHAARAIVTRDGLGGGVDESVTRDLATAAVASGDDPAVLLLRARAAVASGDTVLAQTSARQARAKARAWGPAALAQVLAFDANAAGGAGRCDPLIDAREPWTDDALTACRALTASGAAPPESAPAAQRLVAGSRDPMQLALASCALGETQRVPANILTEYAGWLAIAGRADLSQRAMNPEDGGR
jgi:ribosomal protein L40E